MASQLADNLKKDWQQEVQEDRVQKRRPTRKAERSRTDPEHARIQDARVAYQRAIEDRLHKAMEAFAALYQFTEGLPPQKARAMRQMLDAGIAALDKDTGALALFDACLKVLGPYADAGAKQKAVYVTKKQPDNQQTSDKAQQEQRDREARNADIVQSPKPAAVLAREHGLTRQHIYRIRKDNKSR